MNPNDQRAMELGTLSLPHVVPLLVCILLAAVLAYILDKSFDWLWHVIIKHKKN